ncbi:MAG: tryptophan 7-halogenase [Gammaproteobacteria bacterium]|nr:tryptophan 7-halogenase [Gammaproteobacteria bacterium]MYF53574.1 tryptophan 7-halogenase [Gammaproteobacteria bacterium]MYK42824.1 tryptophan 7-halogenase [Gammaproteobacteria bacterium]
MIQPGREHLRKIAVVGRGTAGSLAAASVNHHLDDGEYELHHIYDSRIPVIGVGEGSWPSLVQELHTLTNLPHADIQNRIKGTRKYGVAFEGWGRGKGEFIHYFTPQQVSYAYHLAADLVAEMLHEHSSATHIDAKVLNIDRDGERARLEFEGRESEVYDLVFDARGFPKELLPEQHIDISFIPTNTAVIRRCGSIFNSAKSPVLQHTYTRAVARPHGWVFVIPLTAHTSYGYIFNREISSLEAIEEDFDMLLKADGVVEYEQRAILNFPNFVHRQLFDGVIARVGNSAAFMEPLEATAIVSAQLQIGMVLTMRLNRSIEFLERDAPAINRFLINTILRYGLFVGWHYSCGSAYESEFWSYAQEHVWPRHISAAKQEKVGCDALEKFMEMLELIRSPVIDKRDWNKMCAVPLTSYAQISQGIGY